MHFLPIAIFLNPHLSITILKASIRPTFLPIVVGLIAVTVHSGFLLQT